MLQETLFEDQKPQEELLPLSCQFIKQLLFLCIPVLLIKHTALHPYCFVCPSSC